MWLGGNTTDAANAAMNRNGVFKVGGITVNSSGRIWLHSYGAGGDALTTYVGAGGINIADGKTGYVGIENSNFSSTVRPWNSDFTIGKGARDDYDFSLNGSNITFSLDTDDEQGVPRTITLAARLKSSDDTSSFVVKGAGTNVVTSVSTRMLGTNVVAGTATELLMNGASFPNSTVSVGATATLGVGESGTATVSNLVLAADATLAFNFTDRTSAPLLAVSSVTAGGTTRVSVSGARPKGSSYVLTSGGAFAGNAVELAAEGNPKWARAVSVNADGDIVLDVKHPAMMVILR